MTNQEKINSLISKLHDYYNNNHLEESNIKHNHLFMKFSTVHNSEMIIDISFSEYENTKYNIDIDLDFIKILRIYKDDALNECLFEIIRNVLSEKIMKESDKLKEIFMDKDIKK